MIGGENRMRFKMGDWNLKYSWPEKSHGD